MDTVTWNYRIIFHDEDPDPDRHWYGLHECYYCPTGWTVNPTTFGCDADEGPEVIIKSLEMALRDAKTKPIIVESAPLDLVKP